MYVQISKAHDEIIVCSTPFTFELHLTECVEDSAISKIVRVMLLYIYSLRHNTELQLQSYKNL